VIIAWIFLAAVACTAQGEAVGGARSTTAGADRLTELVAQLGALDREARGSAVRELYRIGDPAIPELIRALRSPQDTARISAALLLGWRGPAAAPAVTALIAALDDENYKVRINALFALRAIGPGAYSSVPCILDALKDTDALVRENAAATLKTFGKAAARALDALETLAREDKDEKVRAQAKAAAEKIRQAQERP